MQTEEENDARGKQQHGEEKWQVSGMQRSELVRRGKSLWSESNAMWQQKRERHDRDEERRRMVARRGVQAGRTSLNVFGEEKQGEAEV